METAGAELGSFCLVSTTADLELRLHSSAKFAADDRHFTIEELINKALNSSPAARPWVSKSDCFKLIATLGLDETDVEPDSLLQTFAHKLYHSKMWHQLCLVPTSMTISNDKTLTIQLSHSTDDEQLAADRHQYHRLSDGLPCSGLRPLPEMPTLEFISVHLTMRIIQKQESKRRRLHAPETPECHTWRLDPTESPRQSYSNGMLGPNQTATPRRAFTAGNDIRMLHLVGGTTLEDAGLNSQQVKRSHSTSDLNHRRKLCSQNDVLELLDAGIRHAVSAQPMRPANGIQLTESESIKHLADFAPSIWSPGHLAAMSSRSLMIPTISHALSHVGVGNTKSTALKVKTAEVLRRAACESISASSTLHDVQQLQITQLSIGSRLWQAAQCTLLDESAASQLKGFSLHSDDMLDSAQQELLDVGIDSEADAVYSDSNESMIDLEDSGYASDDDLLSIHAKSRSSSLEAGFGRECDSARRNIAGNVTTTVLFPGIDEEMLCT